MTYELPKNFKCCLTCAYWAGNRQPTSIERYATTDSTRSKGMCTSEKGFYHLEMEAASAGCSGWTPWPVLKD